MAYLELSSLHKCVIVRTASGIFPFLDTISSSDYIIRRWSRNGASVSCWPKTLITEPDINETRNHCYLNSDNKTISLCLCVCLSICLSVHPSVRLSVCLSSVSLSVCLCLCLSLSVWLSVSLYLHYLHCMLHVCET